MMSPETATATSMAILFFTTPGHWTTLAQDQIQKARRRLSLKRRWATARALGDFQRMIRCGTALQAVGFV